MNARKKFKCQTCHATHRSLVGVLNCCPPSEVWVCDRCGREQGDDKKAAEQCCKEDDDE